MGKSSIPLELVKIASPCSASWDAMHGDNYVRHCNQCRLNVYNLSALSRSEAESLIAATEGKRCVRLYRRADGTVITRDCPVGWQAMKRRLASIGSVGAAALVAMLGVFNWSMAIASGANPSREMDNPLHRFVDNLFGNQFRPWFGKPAPQALVMGEMCVTPAPDQAPAAPIEKKP